MTGESRKKKEEIEVKGRPENAVPAQASDAAHDHSKKDSALVVALVVLAILLVAVFFLPKLFIGPPATLEDLHSLNFEGKLSSDEGYVYNGQYSFVKKDGLWYLLLNVPAIGRSYNIPFHYGPREVADILPAGIINKSTLDQYRNFFITFDPLDQDLQYIAASVGESNAVFINVFSKNIIPACTRNETSACVGRPIVNCNSTASPVFYFASEEETNLIYLSNCAIISGKGTEIFRATDRMIFDFLGIMQ